jgi:hypothetical protein
LPNSRLADDESGSCGRSREASVGCRTSQGVGAERDGSREKADLDRTLEQTDLGKVLGLLSPRLCSSSDAIAGDRGTRALGAGNNEVDELVMAVVEDQANAELGAVADLLDNSWMSVGV